MLQICSTREVFLAPKNGISHHLMCAELVKTAASRHVPGEVSLGRLVDTSAGGFLSRRGVPVQAQMPETANGSRPETYLDALQGCSCGPENARCSAANLSSGPKIAPEAAPIHKNPRVRTGKISTTLILVDSQRAASHSDARTRCEL